MTDDPLLAKYGHSKNGHSIFAPSAAASWLTCSGSLLVNARAGDTAGFDAAQGTVAHHVAEVWNKTGQRPDYLIGTRVVERAGGADHVIKITEDMLYHVGRFVEWCRELPGDHYFEQRVDLSELTPIPSGGTADHFACEHGRLVISDLKYGTGVRVYAERNPQAMLYAAGAFMEWDWVYGFRTITIRIAQPRLDVFEVWECSREELLQFMEYVKVRAVAAWNEDAPRAPSKKACRFCAGEATCPARLNELNSIVDEIFETDDDDLAPEDDQARGPGKEYPAEALQKVAEAATELAHNAGRLAGTTIPELSTRQLAFVLTVRRQIESFLKAAAETLLDRAERGEEIPWHKLGDGRKKRGWKDRAEAIAFIESTWGLPEHEIAPPTLVTPAKAEKLIRAKHPRAKPREVKDALARVISEFAGKRTLMPLKDDRPDVDDLLLEDFDEETEEDDDDS